MVYLLVTALTGSRRPEFVTSLPSWSCGFDSRRPLHKSLFLRHHQVEGDTKDTYADTLRLHVIPFLGGCRPSWPLPNARPDGHDRGKG
jgi:hypothetical protein